MSFFGLKRKVCVIKIEDDDVEMGDSVVFMGVVVNGMLFCFWRMIYVDFGLRLMMIM